KVEEFNASGTPSLSEGFRPMEPSVATRVGESKILDPIIALDSVDVVDVFGSKQRAAQMLLHNPTMFKDALASDANPDVLARRASELSSKADRAAAIAAEPPPATW